MEWLVADTEMALRDNYVRCKYCLYEEEARMGKCVLLLGFQVHVEHSGHTSLCTGI